MLVFVEGGGGKTEEPVENLPEQGGNQQPTQPTYDKGQNRTRAWRSHHCAALRGAPKQLKLKSLKSIGWMYNGVLGFTFFSFLSELTG